MFNKINVAVRILADAGKAEKTFRKLHLRQGGGSMSFWSCHFGC